MTASTPEHAVVLIVDDSPDTLGMLNQTLDEAGLTVLVALDGNQALTISKRLVPDIILLDAIMPHLDGFATCRLLKQQPALVNVPVIFMTGLSDTEDIVKGLEAGGVDYVTKPVKSAELLARMRVHLGNARQTQRANAALDTAGQFLFTSDLMGRLLWATPQVQALLDETSAGASEWISSALPEQLQRWFGHRPAVGQSLNLMTPGHPLQIRYLGLAGTNECLLRLVDMERPAETDILKRHFPVTEREAEVLLWIGRGKTNREIGQILDMSPRTVNKHLEQIFRKLGVENRTSAAALVIACLSGDT